MVDNDGALLSSPWTPFYYFCAPPGFAVLSKASTCSLFWNGLIPGNWCAIKAKSWKYMRITSPWGSPKLMTDGYRQLYSRTYTLSSPVGVSWSYPLRTVPGMTLLLGFLLFPISLPPSFLISLGRTSLINHLHTNPHLRVCIWGIRLRHPSKKFRVASETWGCIA